MIVSVCVATFQKRLGMSVGFIYNLYFVWMINYIFAVKAPAADAHIVESQQMSLLTKDPTTITLALKASHNSFILGQDRFLHE